MNQWANYESGSGTDALTFAFRVVSPNRAPLGTEVIEDSLVLNGGTITSRETGSAANLAHDGLDPDPDHKVDGGRVGGAPVFASAEVNAATLEVTFDKDLDAGSAPAGSAFTVTATPSDGGQAHELHRHGHGLRVRQDGDGEPGLVPGTGGGTRARARPDGARRRDGHGGLHRAGREPAAGRDRQERGDLHGPGRGEPHGEVPSVSGVAFSSTPSHDTDGDGTADTYGPGSKIRVQVTFHTSVSVDTRDGRPRIKIKLVQDKWADYESGGGELVMENGVTVVRGGTKVLTFAYTVATGDMSDGIEVPADTLELNGGTIRGTNSVFATLTHAAVARDTSHRVDGSLSFNRAPTVSVPDADHLRQNAPPDALKTAGMTFADPNIAASALRDHRSYRR